MTRELASTAVCRRQTRSQSIERDVARLAERQYGVVSRAQLVEFGMRAGAIERRLQCGRLHRLHPGVYAVGHRSVPLEALWLAAVLRAGEGAALSHRSAAALWGIHRRDRRARIEVAAPTGTSSCRAIQRHRIRHLQDEITVRHRIPATTLSRTLFDLAAVLSAEPLEEAVREAEYLHRFRARSFAALLERHPGQRGTKTLRTCLRSIGLGPRGRTRSRLEVRFAALLARTDLPRPRLNAAIELDGRQVEVDCMWPSQQVIIELDGAKAHRTRVAFETDRERDRRLQAAGWKVMRVTWRQLDDPDAILRDLRQALRPSEIASASA